MQEPLHHMTLRSPGNTQHRSWRNRRWWPFDAYLSGLIGLGLISTLLYARGITARYPLAVGLRDPRVGWYWISGRSIQAGCVFAVVLGLLMLCYALALRVTLRLRGAHGRVIAPIIIGGWFASACALLGAYPGESFDIFDYLFRGRMIVDYGASPLAVAPFVFKNQPFYDYITWRGQVDTYGPLWEYASGAVAWVVPHVVGRSDSQIAYILGYRLLAVLLAGMCGLLIALIVRRSDPAHVYTALLAWLWNPLVLITTAIGAHNDILMMLALLLAVWLFQRRLWIGGLLALVLAIHVKLTALLLLPVVGIWLLRRRGWAGALRDGVLALALALPLSWLLYAPFGGWFTLRRMLQERARLLINSPADLIYHLLQERYGWAEPAAWRVTTLGATLLFFAAAAPVLAWFWWSMRQRVTADSSEPGDARFWNSCVLITLAYLLIGSFWFQNWYLLWVLGPAVLLPTSRWTLTLLPAYCLGALGSNLTNSFLRGLPGQPFNATQLSALNVLAQVTPLLCVLVVTRIWQDAPRLLAAARRSRATARSSVAIVAATHEMDHRP
jgi:hypothetical protein